MKVLLRKNVPNLGRIGDIVEVKSGHARNYLLPQALAVQPTKANLLAVEAERKRYIRELAKQRSEVEARAELLRGKELTIAARANEEGHLYGSVGPAQIVAALAEESIFLDVENVALDEPIRQLDKYDVEVRFAEDIKATIHVWVVPVHDDEDEGELGEDADVEAAPDDEPDTPIDEPEPDME